MVFLLASHMYALRTYFLNCRIQLLGGCFKRVHTIRQLDPTQSDPTKLDRVNRPIDHQKTETGNAV